MLDAIHPWGRKIQPYRAKGVVALLAEEPWQVQAHYQLRREIFVAEQGIYSDSDRDSYDSQALPIIALCPIAGVGHDVVGVVRIYPDERHGVWFGGRLGVAASHRRVGAVGTALITCAVSTAHALGCREFLATIQPQNVKYFERHDFFQLRSVQVQGRPHVLMQARLDSYPPELSQTPVPVRSPGRIRAA